MGKTQRKLGLALSGAAARSAFYVGFLEVLKEEGIPVSVISAQSGASIVASAFACDTLQHLKEFVFSMNWKKVRPLLASGLSEGALYSIAPAVEYMRNTITGGKRFEELDTKLVFAASNLHTGELVSLAMGDIAQGIQATCAVPGLFAPVRWGNYLLVDGGLISVMPGHLARQAGADVVVGVDAKSTRYIFMPSHITLKMWYNSVRDWVQDNSIVRLWRAGRRALSTDGVEMYIEGNDVVTDEPNPRVSMGFVLARALDLAGHTRAKANTENQLYGCDFIISEGPGRFGDTAALSLAKQTYEDGRRAAYANLSKIRDLLHKQE